LSFQDAMSEHGTDELADLFGGKLVEREYEPELKPQQGFTIPPAMKAKIQAEGLPLFSQEKPASGSSIAVVKDYLTTRQQKLMAEGKIRLVQSHARKGAQGFYDKGVITLVADNLGSKAQVQQVLSHESWHYARDNDSKVKNQAKSHRRAI
jgi:hypothetical protein